MVAEAAATPTRWMGGATERGEEEGDAEADYPGRPPAASPGAHGTLGTDTRCSSVVAVAMFRMEASTAQIVTERLEEEEEGRAQVIASAGPPPAVCRVATSALQLQNEDRKRLS